MPNGGHYSRKTLERKRHSSPALQRRLARGAKKLAAKHARAAARANRFSPHHQALSSGIGVAPDPITSSDPATPQDHATPLTKEHQA